MRVEDVGNGRKSVQIDQWAWPDGAGYAQQDNLTVCMFALLREQLAEALSR